MRARFTFIILKKVKSSNKIKLLCLLVIINELEFKLVICLNIINLLII